MSASPCPPGRQTRSSALRPRARQAARRLGRRLGARRDGRGPPHQRRHDGPRRPVGPVEQPARLDRLDRLRRHDDRRLGRGPARRPARPAHRLRPHPAHPRHRHRRRGPVGRRRHAHRPAPRRGHRPGRRAARRLDPCERVRPPRRIRGRMVVWLESLWALGWILAALLGRFLVPRTLGGVPGWRWALLVGIVPAVFSRSASSSPPRPCFCPSAEASTWSSEAGPAGAVDGAGRAAGVSP